MIKSIKGDTTIHGNTWELTFELHHLIRQLSVVCPEILSAVMYKDREYLEKAVFVSDPKEIILVENIIDIIEEERSKLDDGN